MYLHVIPEGDAFPCVTHRKNTYFHVISEGDTFSYVLHKGGGEPLIPMYQRGEHVFYARTCTSEGGTLHVL